MSSTCQQHHIHLEAYFGIPSAGLVVHTINIKLHEDDIAYIINHAEDKVLIIDIELLSLLEKIKNKINVKYIVENMARHQTITVYVLL